MEQRLSLVTLGVADLARSTAFYERLGWTRALRDAAGVAFFRAGGTAIVLWPLADLAADAGVAPQRHGFAGIALAHNVRARADVDAVLAEAAAAGAAVLKPAADTFYGGYAGYFADSDGFAWEVAWNPHFPFAADGSLVLAD